MKTLYSSHEQRLYTVKSKFAECVAAAGAAKVRISNSLLLKAARHQVAGTYHPAVKHYYKVVHGC